MKLGAQFASLTVSTYEEPDIDDSAVVSVNGEISSLSGDAIKGELTIHVAVYDQQKRVIGKGSDWIATEVFSGFDVFSIEVCIMPSLADRIGSILIYPKYIKQTDFVV